MGTIFAWKKKWSESGSVIGKNNIFFFKVEKILKGSLVSIPSTSPSVKIQIMVGKVEMQNIAGRCQQTFENKKIVDITQQCFALLPQVNFPAHALIFQ